jgi:hypothetical protein
MFRNELCSNKTIITFDWLVWQTIITGLSKVILAYPFKIVFLLSFIVRSLMASPGELLITF